tara:strand:- start:238 stop:435 length:198 start_codon:yes stop_codon:yes gene_type:complete
MRSDKEILKQADRDITKLPDNEYERFLVLEARRKKLLSKAAEKADGGMIKGFSPIARPQRFKGVF